MNDARRDLATLPKAELHLHLEGSMRPETLAELADAAGIPVPEIRGYGSFSAFAGTYLAACEVIRSYDDVLRLVREVAVDRHAAGAVWIEPSFYLPLHEGRLGSPSEVLAMMLLAAGTVTEELGIGIGLMPAGDRTDHPEVAVGQAELAAAHAGRGVVGFGLSNDEAIGPLEHFADAFAVARARRGCSARRTPASWRGPTRSRSRTTSCAAERIEHGVRAVDDPELVARLAASGTCLDVCLTSNVMLSVVPDITEHPLPRLLHAGVRCTLNTDDSLLFGPGLLAEYELAATRSSSTTPRSPRSPARRSRRRARRPHSSATPWPGSTPGSRRSLAVMTEPVRSSLAREIGVFPADDPDAIVGFFREHGFAIVRGVHPDDQLAALEADLLRQQARLVAGELPAHCGTVILDDAEAVIDGEPFAHYVCHVTEVSEVGAGGGVPPGAREPRCPGSSVRSVGCSRTTGSAWCTRTRAPAFVRATRASAGTPTRSRVPPSRCGRRSASPSISTPRHRRTASSAWSPAHIAAAPMASRSASSGCRASSPCTRRAAT